MTVTNTGRLALAGDAAAARARLGKPLLVQKYGGSSVATVAHVKNVAKRVVARQREGNAVVVVVSAMGKTTDSLVSLSKEITATPNRREMDLLLHAGEIISSSLLAMAITECGVPAVALTGQQAGMRTDGSHTEAKVHAVEGSRVLDELSSGHVVVVAGFQGVTESLEITTLGRGGSDTSAVAVAVGIGADRCEILTDVDGVYTTDPRVAKKARRMDWCSYDEMLELAILGAKVLHSRSVEIARRYDLPILVATSFSDAPGTVICSPEYRAKTTKKELGAVEEVTLRGIAHKTDVAKISLLGVPDQPGIAGQVFAAIGAEDVSIQLIVQAEHRGGTNDISFLIPAASEPRLRGHLDALLQQVKGEKVLIDLDVATISLVGEGVQREPGVAARFFNALALENINIDLISTSNLMVTCVIAEADTERAVQAVHRTFFEEGGTLPGGVEKRP